jgi:hypothetical protein
MTYLHRLLPAFAAGLLFQGCATIVSPSQTKVNVYADRDSSYVQIKGDSSIYLLPAVIITGPEREDLHLTLTRGRLSRDLIIRRKLSTAFWLGNMFSFGMAGYAIDLINKKLYDYPADIYVETSRSPGKYKRFAPPVRDLVDMSFSVSEANHILLNTPGPKGSGFGFLGFCPALSLYTSDMRFFQIGGGIVATHPFPFPVFLYNKGFYKRYYSWYADLHTGIDLKRFKISAGLGFVYNIYLSRFGRLGDFNSLLSRKEESRLLVSLSAAYRVNRSFLAGINYKPSFYSFSDRRFNYAHLLFLSLTVNFELYRPQQKRSVIKRP